MSCFRLLVICLISVCVISSCTVQKRRYTKGFYFCSVKKTSEKAGHRIVSAKHSAGALKVTVLEDTCRREPKLCSLAPRNLQEANRSGKNASCNFKVLPLKNKTLATNTAKLNSEKPGIERSPAKMTGLTDASFAYQMLSLLGAALLALGFVLYSAANPLGLILLGIGLAIGCVLVVLNILLMIEWLRSLNKGQLLLFVLFVLCFVFAMMMLLVF